MLSLYNIQTIARYERRILLRSWFFRIFAILSLLFIGIFSAATIFDKNPFTWMYRSLPSALIYSNLFLLNIIQSVIAVFLATDFLKRDKKLNTSEVLFIRPMTNADYVIGKTWGLMVVFILLNGLLIVLTSIYLLISKQIEFQILPIIYYFLLVSIPTLVFVIGLSYVLMILIRNQPITFILLLGYIALILFYLGSKYNYLFDYMVFVKPMAYSDVIGFGNLFDVLLHRISYLVLGIAFIFFTAWRLNRLPNAKSSSWILGALTFILLGLAASGFYTLFEQNRHVLEQRKTYYELSSAYFDRLVPEITHASIEVEHGKTLTATSTMDLKNTTSQNIDTLFFSLNPGLKVSKVAINGKTMEFEQNLLLVKVPLDQAMLPDQLLVLAMNYSGKPDFNIAYLDNKDEDVFGYDRAMTLRIDRQYGFYTKNFVLLTKENLWYPVAGIPYDPSRPAIFRQQFTRFDLKVTTTKKLTPMSQGQRETDDSLSYRFKIRDPLPQLSLSIGNYEEKELDLQGISLKLASIKGHNYYDEYLNELGDTASTLIQEFLDDYERPLGLYYPYAEFSLVEVPVQFSSRSHSWTSTRAQSQPQTVYFPEGGFNMRQADFKSSYRRMERDSERNKEGLSKKEIQARVFTNFLKSVFTADNADIRMGGGSPSASTESNPYSIFPNYFYYVNYITSDECPVLNYAFESYLMKGEDDPRMMFMARMTGLGDNEQANLLLKEKSLKQIIAEEEDKAAVNRVLKAKGAYLLTWMEKQINDTNFDQYLLDYLYDNSYREIKYKELSASVAEKFHIELGSFLSDWYNANHLPAFGLGDFTSVETIDQNIAIFLVKTKVTNYSDVDGMVKFTFQLGEGGRGGRGGGFFGGGATQTEPEERIYLINANETREIQVKLNESPRSVIFNTLLSQNIPSSTMKFGLRAEKNEKAKAEEFERSVDLPVTLESEGELVVDNSDPGFSVHDPSLENPLRKFVEKRKTASNETEYVAEGFGPAPTTWSLNANADYFGKIEHSAMIIRSGDGTKTATWKKKLPKAGYYDIYVHLNSQRRSGPGRNRGGEAEGKYVYSVVHDDGIEEVELDIKDFESGWNILGSFYLSSDSASVTLTDKGGANRIVADAVKWSLQR
ncbi:MAG: hypothetical protein ACERKD_03645 [Prolixibacteraceae bacterium]